MPQPPLSRSTHRLARHSSLVTRHWPILFFTALAVAFLAPVLFGNRTLLPTGLLMGMSPWAEARLGAGSAPPAPTSWNPILWDAIAQFYPWRAFAAHWMRRGIIPFWDPHQFCGTPFLANSQSALLYPLHLLLLDTPTAMPVTRAMALLAAIHLVLAGFLTYLWLRALRLSRFAALLGGVAFMFSGFAVTWLELPSFLTVACWLPLLFLTLHRTIEAPTLPRAAGLAAAVGLTLLGGHLQVAFYCLLAAALYALWSVVVQAFRRSVFGIRCSAFGDPTDPTDLTNRSDYSSHLAEHRTPNTQHLYARAPAFVLLAVFLGGMLAAPQLLPAVELSRHSHRVSTASAGGYSAYVGGAMRASQLVRLFLPDFYGNPTRGDYAAGSPADYTEYAGWLGGVGLMLALAGLLAWKRRPRETLFAGGLLALSLLLALGTPLNALFYFGIPGFSQSGSPARVLVLFCFAGAWLVGLGAEAVSGDWRVVTGHSPLATAWLSLAALLVWVILLVAALAPARAFVAGGGGDFAAFLARSGPALQRTLMLVALAALLPLGLRVLGRGSSVSPALAEGLSRGVVGALLLGELWMLGAGFNPTGPLAEVYPSTSLIAALRTGSTAIPGRVLPLNRRWSLFRNPHACLPPNNALALGLLDPQGYDSLFLGSYKGFANLVQGTDTAPPENGNMLFLSRVTSPLFPLLAADRVVSNEPLSAGAASVVPADWPRLYEQNGLHVYRCPAALPRAFLAPHWRATQQERLAGELQRLAGAHELGTTALVETAPAAGKAGASYGDPRVGRTEARRSGGGLFGVRRLVAAFTPAACFCSPLSHPGVQQPRSALRYAATTSLVQGHGSKLPDRKRQQAAALQTGQSAHAATWIDPSQRCVTLVASFQASHATVALRLGSAPSDSAPAHRIPPGHMEKARGGLWRLNPPVTRGRPPMSPAIPGYSLSTHQRAAMGRAYARPSRPEARFSGVQPDVAGGFSLRLAAAAPAGSAASPSAAPTPVDLRDVSPNQVLLTLPQPRIGMLVLLDNDYPGWRAVDANTGRPLPLAPVDLTFRGVPLSGTTRAVRMRYEPASFRLGLYLAALAVGVLTAFGVGGRRGR